MSDSQAKSCSDTELVETALHRVAHDLGGMVGHEIQLGEPTLERKVERQAADGIHIGFHCRFSTGVAQRFGSLQAPLAEVMTLAAYMLMCPDDEVDQYRAAQAPDDLLKDAILELGNLVAGALEESLRGLDHSYRVRFAGCQGIRSGVRPAFEHADGDELLVARVPFTIGNYPESELLFQVPMA